MIYWRVVWNEPGIWYPEHADFTNAALATEAAEWLRQTGAEGVTVHELRYSE